MLNILPRVTGLLVARHLKISHSAAPRSGAHSPLERSQTPPKDHFPGTDGRARALTLRAGGLLVRLDRDYPGIAVKISKDGEARESFSGLRDMREVLDKVRTSAENYQRPGQSGWAVVPTDQYAFTNFL